MLQYDLFEEDPSIDPRIKKGNSRWYIDLEGKRIFFPSDSAAAEYLAERDNGNA